MKEAQLLSSSLSRPVQDQTLTGKTDTEVIDMWTRETDFDQRDKILKVLIERKLFPKDETATVENDGALYPDVDDPLFIAKLLRKREFAENKQRSMAEILAEGEDLCDPTREFEISPVQRFITRFLSPETPYNSALLFHGVGVGKTCAAISTAEAYLEKYPRKQVIIIAPPNIQSGFERTIFDINSVKFGDSVDTVNEARGCTGNTYLRLTNTEYVREKNLVQARVSKLMRKRYLMYGYLEFYNYVNKIMERVPKGIPPERRAQIELQNLRNIFSGRLIIIDEAHNLRDIGSETETEDNIDAPAGADDIKESEAGKKLTPVLRRILDVTEGTKLMLLTATPMYNSYREIIFLFNLLLRNDKKAEISDSVVFKNGVLTDIGKKLLGNTASAYMSFMRGENPLSFPIRLDPEGVSRVTRWSTVAPNGAAISDVERERMVNLPLIKVEFTDDALRYYDALTRNTIESKICAWTCARCLAGAAPSRPRISSTRPALTTASFPTCLGWQPSPRPWSAPRLAGVFWTWAPVRSWCSRASRNAAARASLLASSTRAVRSRSPLRSSSARRAPKRPQERVGPSTVPSTRSAISSSGSSPLWARSSTTLSSRAQRRSGSRACPQAASPLRLAPAMAARSPYTKASLRQRRCPVRLRCVIVM